MAVDGEIRDYGAGRVFVAEELFGSEGGFVEVDGFGSVSDGEEGGDGGRDGIVRHGWFAPVFLEDILWDSLSWVRFSIVDVGHPSGRACANIPLMR